MQRKWTTPDSQHSRRMLLSALKGSLHFVHVAIADVNERHRQTSKPKKNYFRVRHKLHPYDALSEIRIVVTSHVSFTRRGSVQESRD